MIPLEGLPPGFFLHLKPNDVTKWVDPWTNYSGPRFYRAIDWNDACVSNLTLLEHVKAVWAFEKDKSIYDNPSDTEIFGPGKYLPSKPQCPGGGSYMLNVGTRPQCTLSSSAAHSL
jgi:hypothetical protein